MNRAVAEVLGERAPQTPPTKREQKEADRIAGRALYNIRRGKLAFTVKGGLFGRNNTVHDDPVYDLVARRLLDTMDEVEISVVRISGITATGPGCKGSVKIGYADVLSAKKIGGFTKYPSPSPTENPQAFIDGGMGFGTVPSVGPFTLDLVYPHPSGAQGQPAEA